MDVVSRSVAAKTGYIGSHNLIQDVMPLKLIKPAEKVMVEDAYGKKRHAVRLGGQFQYADRPNANGRIYDSSVLSHAVKEISEDIKARRVLGELDHPPDAKIHLDRVSHVMTKLWMEGNGVFGEIEVIEGTTAGNVLKALIEAGVTIGISSRGIGDMEPIMREGNEYLKVLPGYTFVTFDVVAEPSVHGSYLSVMESKNRLMGTQKKAVTRESIEKEIFKAAKGRLFGRGR